MKASFVSSLSMSQAMRYSTMRTQGDLAKALKEQDTGKVFDAGLALGARTAQTVTFARDLERLNGIVDSNGLVSARLKATQEALGNITSAAQDSAEKRAESRPYSSIASITASRSNERHFSLTPFSRSRSSGLCQASASSSAQTFG